MDNLLKHCCHQRLLTVAGLLQQQKSAKAARETFLFDLLLLEVSVCRRFQVRLSAKSRASEYYDSNTCRNRCSNSRKSPMRPRLEARTNRRQAGTVGFAFRILLTRFSRCSRAQCYRIAVVVKISATPFQTCLPSLKLHFRAGLQPQMSRIRNSTCLLREVYKPKPETSNCQCNSDT